MRREQGVRVAAVALAGVLLTCCSAGSSSSGTGSGTGPGTRTPTPPPPTATAPGYPAVTVPITAVLVQDGGLRLSTQALGGGCRRLALQARESSTEVRLTLTMTRPPGICPPYVLLVEVSTTLHTPLGHRRLVDAATGRPITPHVGAG